jgi:hypothetical protein
MGRNSEIASGIFKSDFILAAIIPNKKNRMIGVSKFDWIKESISIITSQKIFAEIKTKVLKSHKEINQKSKSNSHCSTARDGNYP